MITKHLVEMALRLLFTSVFMEIDVLKYRVAQGHPSTTQVKVKKPSIRSLLRAILRS